MCARVLGLLVFLLACSLLVQTLFCTRLPHVPITLLGSDSFKRRQTTDAAARTRASFLYRTLASKLRISGHVVTKARKKPYNFAHLPSINAHIPDDRAKLLVAMLDDSCLMQPKSSQNNIVNAAGLASSLVSLSLSLGYSKVDFLGRYPSGFTAYLPARKEYFTKQ